MKFLSIFFVLIIFVSEKSFGEKISVDTNNVKFSSDTIKIDEKNKIVIASGNVVIINLNRETFFKRLDSN